MNPETHGRVVEEARRALAGIRGVRSVILFGSVALGRATEDSDIDLLVECDEEREGEVRTILFDLARVLGVEFSPIFYKEKERGRFDTQFLESVCRSGRVLLGSMPSLTLIDLDLQPLRLVSYRTTRLSARERAELLRAIDGYRTVKRVGKKRYVSEKPGVLRDIGGWRVGRGAVIVPEEAVDRFDGLLRRYGATRHIVPIWCQRP